MKVIPSFEDFTGIELKPTQPEPRVPSLAIVFREQLRMISMAGGSSMGFMVLAGAALIFLAWDPRFARLDFPVDYLPLPGLLIGAVAWAPLVWRGQGPTKRGYHRALPVNQLTHDLIKIAAGAAWLMLGVAIVLLPLLGSALYWPHTRDLLSGPPIWVWINFFTGPLIVYLLVSCVPMLTDKPLEWMLGLTGGLVGLQTLANTYSIEPFYSVTSELVRGDIGLVNALYGAYNQAHWEVYVQWARSLPRDHYGEWIAATILWLLLSVSAVCLVSNYANSRKVA
jgi:hypothetical protein